MRDDPTRSSPPDDDDSSIDEIREKKKPERLEEIIPERRWYKTRELTPYEEAMENYRKREESRVDWIAEEKEHKKPERLEEIEVGETRDYRRKKVRVYKTPREAQRGKREEEKEYLHARGIRGRLQRAKDVVGDVAEIATTYSDPIATWYGGKDVYKKGKKKHVPGAKEQFFAGIRSASTQYGRENRALRREGRAIEREFSLLGGIEKPRHRRERQYRSPAREARATYANIDEIGMGMLGFVPVGKRDYGRNQWTAEGDKYHGESLRSPFEAFALGMPKKKGKGGSGIPDFFRMKL